MEVINAPSPVKTSRNNEDLYEEGKLLSIAKTEFGNYSYETSGKATKYIHFILNQRTIPLHRSFPECPERDDGWCELDTFLALQSKSYELSQYDWSCNGDYPAVPYGNITDGVPIHASP
jgi:hypothetical protein